MTALKEFEKLEATGLWRDSVTTQRREVIVSFGDTSLLISDSNDAPISHWSLAAVRRLNPGDTPAIFSPNPDDTETLEIEDATLIEAIERVRSAIKRRRPHPGRLRLLVVALLAATTIGLGIFWLPGALVRHTIRVVPPEKRQQIGQELLLQMAQFAGTACQTPLGDAARNKLQNRLGITGNAGLFILPVSLRKSAHLPGGMILLSTALFEDFEGPEVAAGYVVIETARAAAQDPMADLLDYAGLVASFKLLTTGTLDSGILRDYGRHILTLTPQRPDDTTLLDLFGELEFSSEPLAYEIDVTGETTLTLIEADPYRAKSYPALLGDSDWISLQGICGG